MALREFMALRFAVDKFKPIPNMSLYRSDIPIDSIAPPDKHNPDLKGILNAIKALLDQSIGWPAAHDPM